MDKAVMLVFAAEKGSFVRVVANFAVGKVAYFELGWLMLAGTKSNLDLKSL